MTQPISVAFQGQLAAIYIGECKGEALHAVPQIEAIAGRGLAGDRYCRNEGTFSKPGKPEQEVTLIESEALQGIAREADLHLESHQARRNLLTQGVPLNHLVGREFQVGDVVLKGIRLCEPCGHLESLTVKGVQDALCHRGGLRAQIVRGGVLHMGDIIQPLI